MVDSLGSYRVASNSQALYIFNEIIESKSISKKNFIKINRQNRPHQ